MEARIAQEDFTATGLMVVERNWLNVYKYTTWGGSEVPPMQPGATFVPAELLLRQGQTEPPPKLTERDLLSLMDRFGIGTDATVSDHIAKQQVWVHFLLTLRIAFMTCGTGRACCGATLRRPSRGSQHTYSVVRHSENSTLCLASICKLQASVAGPLQEATCSQW